MASSGSPRFSSRWCYSWWAATSSDGLQTPSSVASSFAELWRGYDQSSCSQRFGPLSHGITESLLKFESTALLEVLED